MSASATSALRIARRGVLVIVLGGITGALAFGGIIAALAMAAPSKPPKSKTVDEWMSRHGVTADPTARVVAGPTADVHEDASPIEERVYDISAALKKLRSIDPKANARQWLEACAYLPPGQRLSISQLDSEPNRVRLTMTRRQHQAFARSLEALARSGPWQITIQSRFLRAPDYETLGDIDWKDAVKFAAPVDRPMPHWPKPSAETGSLADTDMSVSVKSESWNYAPYLAFVAGAKQMQQIMSRLQNHPRGSVLFAPKVVVANGQSASVCTESSRPFVVGVQYVEGELATAAQPEVAVLSEGMSLDVQPLLIDADTLDLQCRLTVAHIDDVGEIKLPGQEVTVQNPRASRTTIEARCQLKRGQTLFIAPITDANNDDGAVYYYAVTPEWRPDLLRERKK